jgi:uncharacterized membrane protein
MPDGRVMGSVAPYRKRQIDVPQSLQPPSALIAPHIAAPVAYLAGALGTLIGADLLNLHRLTSLGAGVASIGGAVTFDGIFLTSIIAVLLVSVS